MFYVSVHLRSTVKLAIYGVFATGGAAGSVALITGSLGRALAVMSFDSDYRKVRLTVCHFCDKTSDHGK